MATSTALKLALIVLFAAVPAIHSLADQCRTVKKGNFYESWWPFHGFHTGTVKSQVVMAPDTANYLFTPQDPKGWLCQTSWNKLYGGSRCGYIHLHHDDSDRFVWRRPLDCILNNGSHVIGVKPNCPYANMVQIAAYSYDLGHEPFKNSSLLTVFNTYLVVNQTYTLQIDFNSNNAVYTLLDATGTKALESHVINHTPCADYDEGYMLSLYFGGQCPAPSDVTICYSDTNVLKHPKMR